MGGEREGLRGSRKGVVAPAQNGPRHKPLTHDALVISTDVSWGGRGRLFHTCSAQHLPTPGTPLSPPLNGVGRDGCVRVWAAERLAPKAPKNFFHFRKTYLKLSSAIR